MYRSLRRTCLATLSAAVMGACGAGHGGATPQNGSGFGAGGIQPEPEAERVANDMAEADDAFLEVLARDASAVEAGRAAYRANCVPCHRDDAGGVIGPNLTDAYWIRGGGARQILDAIARGVPERGMPGWGVVLGKRQNYELTAFVLSLRGHAVDGRPPEGDVIANLPGASE